MKHIKNFLLTALIIITPMSSLAIMSLSGTAYAQSAAAKNSACNGVGEAAGGNGCDPNASNEISSLIETIVNIMSIFVGVISVIMVIISGFKFITAQGDPQSISSARNTLTYALVGLVVAALAQVLVHFVLSKIH